MNTITNTKLQKHFLLAFVEIIIFQLIAFYKRMIKYFLRFVTRQTELERICHNEKIESVRINKIEKCFLTSRNDYIRLSLESKQENEEEIALKIMQLKNIPQSNINFLILLKDGLIKIRAYNKLVNEIEELRLRKFSFDNLQDSELIFDLWNSLKGSTDKLDNKITKRWSEIGFQGNDPSTDFRGMGMLSLLNLHYFSTNMNEKAKQVYNKSLHPKLGYPFSIVGISITSWVYKLLNGNFLKTHFYNDSELLSVSSINLENFHKIYCVLFIEFDQYWFLNEPNVMNFEKNSKLFFTLVANKLKNDPRTIIKENFLGKNLRV